MKILLKSLIFLLYFGGLCQSSELLRQKRSPYPDGYNGLPRNFQGQIQWKSGTGRVRRRDTFNFDVRLINAILIIAMINCNFSRNWWINILLRMWSWKRLKTPWQQEITTKSTLQLFQLQHKDPKISGIRLAYLTLQRFTQIDEVPKELGG